MIRRFAALARGLALVATCSFGAARAEQFTSVIDPSCQLPRVDLRQPADDSLYELLAAQDPTSATWERVMSVAPEGHDHSWFDPAARLERLRFYRWMRIHPRPPLAIIDDFRLVDHLGVSHDLARDGDAEAIVLVFTDNASLADTWALLDPVQKTFADGSVRFWLVNPTDSRGDLAAAAAAAGVTLPVLHDSAQLVSRAYGARRSGEVVAIDPAMMEEMYRGAISANCEVNGTVVRQDYLADALALHHAQKPVRVTLTQSQGTALAIEPPQVANYSTEIAPLLRRSCVKCHRPGDIGTFAMTNHATVASYAAAIRVNLIEGKMPPWHADAPQGTFSNDQSLTPAETARLAAWAEAGAPRGDGEDPLVTHPPAPAVDWPLGPPDAIVTIDSQSIPAASQSPTIPYQYVFTTTPFPTNVWLRAATVKPGNRQVVHHALVFAGNFSDLAALKGGLGGYFAGYVPGMEQAFYPDGVGKQLKAGSIIMFQMHYTPIASGQTDKTQLGLYLSKTKPAKELKTGSAYNTSFVIDPDTKVAPASADTTFAKAVTLFEFSPHMHFRGSSMRFDAILPDGTTQTLLNVPNYDFAWQSTYRLAKPVTLPAGSRLHLSGTFDNSVWNPFNPDPSRTVTFGEQTSDEMFIGYVNYAE